MAIKTKQSGGQTEKASYLVGILAWLVPGAGHWYLGRRDRAAIIFAAVCATFLLGVLLGGVEVVDPGYSAAWFCAQVLAGLPALISVAAQHPGLSPGYGRGVDIGQIYAGVAGLLNLLCIVDVLMPSREAGDRKV